MILVLCGKISTEIGPQTTNNKQTSIDKMSESDERLIIKVWEESTVEIKRDERRGRRRQGRLAYTAVCSHRVLIFVNRQTGREACGELYIYLRLLPATSATLARQVLQD